MDNNKTSPERNRKNRGQEVIVVEDERKRDFYICDNVVIDDPTLSIHAKSAYQVILRHAGHNSRLCFLLMSTIARKMGKGVAKSTARRAVAELESKGLIKRKERPGQSTQYRVVDVEDVYGVTTPPQWSGVNPTVMERGKTEPRRNGAGTPPQWSGDPAVMERHNNTSLTRLLEQEETKGSAQPALLPLPSEKRKPEKQQDARFPQVCEAIRTVWPRVTRCDIDARDARAIREFLERKPSFDGEEIALCVVFRFRSEGENLTLPVRRWIGDVDKYQSGPLNRFGDPLWSVKELPAMRDQARMILGGEPSPQLPLKPDEREFSQASEPVALPPEKHQAATDAARRMKQASQARNQQAYEQARLAVGRIVGMSADAIDEFVKGVTTEQTA